MTARTATSARAIALWLFVLFLAVALGAGLYESRIEVPQWIPDGAAWDADAAREADTGRRFWVYVTTVPLTLLTVVNLVLAWRSRGELRRWWLTASLVSVADRVLTFGYFIPTMIVLMSGTLAPQEALDAAQRWAALDWLRHGLSLAALVCAIRALTLLTAASGQVLPDRAAAQHAE
ncbi:MAG: hypothetical protein AB7R99_20940 [Pseudonocardia sp.]